MAHSDDDLEAQLRALRNLADDAAPIPPDLATTVRSRHRSQRRAHLQIAGAGLAAALVLLGVQVVSSGWLGGEQGADSATSRSEPSATPTPASPVQSTAAELLTEYPEDELLEPGDYVFSVLDAIDVPLSPVLTVPGGYTSIVDGAGVQADDLARYVWVWEVDSVFAHPCDARPAPVGPSAADLAAALAAQQLRTATEPVPVTIGGYDGFYVEIAVPAVVDDSACPGGVFKLWPGRFQRAQEILGQVDMVWIVDVDGQRLVFDAAHDSDADPDMVAELREMVTTATFTPAEDS